MLHTLLICHFGISVQHTVVFILYVYVISMLLLRCGDIEMNPGPVPFVIYAQIVKFRCTSGKIVIVIVVNNWQFTLIHFSIFYKS